MEAHCETGGDSHREPAERKRRERCSTHLASMRSPALVGSAARGAARLTRACSSFPPGGGAPRPQLPLYARIEAAARREDLTEVRRLLAEHDAHSLTHAVEKEQAASSSRSIFGTFVYALGTYFAYNAAATLYAYRACGQAADRQLQEQGGEGTAEVTLHLKSWRSTAILEAPSGSDETRKVRVFPLLTLLPGRESQINCSKAGGWTRYSSGGFETTTSGKRPPETEV